MGTTPPRRPCAIVLLATLAACGAAPNAAMPGSLQNPLVMLNEPDVENAYPRLSTNGEYLLYQSNRTGKWQLFVLDLVTNKDKRLTLDESESTFPDFSPDGQWAVFVSNRDGNEELYRMRIDGGGVEQLTNDPGRDIHPYFSPDGKQVLFNSTRGNGSLDVYCLTLADRSVQRLTTAVLDETCARFSPDGTSYVMLQNAVGQDDLFVVDVASGQQRNLTNTPAVRDGWPVWSGDGKWIYYSTMASGRHCVHRVHPDGSGDETLTDGGDGIEDGRVTLSGDGATMMWNRRRKDGIHVLRATLPQ
jgi:TolB protein